jgi:hypothetical protein
VSRRTGEHHEPEQGDNHMKKLVLAAVTAFAVLVGPAVAAGPASADPYVPVTPTDSRAHPVDRVIGAKQRVRVYFKVLAPGNQRVRGTVFITIRRPNGKIVDVIQRHYHAFHPNRAYGFHRLKGSKKGRHYKIIIRFVGKGFEREKHRVHQVVKFGAR